MKKQFNIVLFFFLALFFNARAQSPNSFTIGQDEFANIDVYTTYYDTTTDILHIGTNEGLFQYTQNKFRPLAMPTGSSSKSFFNLKTNKEGELFCFNLNGQIFKLIGENWEIYFEDKGFVNDGYTNYGFNDSNELIFIGTHRLLKIREDGSIVDLLKKNNFSADSIDILFSYFNHSKKIMSVTGVSEKRTKTGKKECFEFNIVNDSINLFSPLSSKNGFLFDIDNNLFHYENSFICPEPIKTNLEPINAHNCIGYGNFAVACHRTTGLSRLFIENDSLKRKTLFNNRFVSNFHLGKQTSATLGSFKNGVDVVSKLNQVSQQLGDIRITSLKSINDDLCYAGTQNGSMYQIDENSLVLGLTNRSRAIESLLLDTSRNTLFAPLSQQNHLLEIANKTKYILKEYPYYFKSSFVFHGEHYISHNQFIRKAYSEKDRHGKDIFLNNKKIIALQINGITERIFFSDNEKTQSINLKGENPVLLKYQNENFTSNQIQNWDGKTVCATRGKGILIFESNRHIKQITEKDGLVSKGVKQIEVQDDILYILSKGRLQVYDLIKNEFIAVGFEDGLGFEPIQFMSVSKNKVWLAEISKVYTVEISDLIEPNNPSPIYVDSILVNGNRIELDAFDFDYTQKNLKIYYDYRNLLSKNDVSIQYQLVGYDDEWNSVSAFENLIEFQSLAPGEYEFKLKASIGNNEGKVFTYSFSITPPIWQRGWFYLLIIAGTIFVTWLVFRSIIKAQRKKAKEKLEKERLSASVVSSQLKALRSQMNPHFIFNSLNSIQDMVLEKDTERSYDSIVLFSRLVRNALNYSQKEFIFLSKEIEFLEVYLKLEKLRLGDDFQYSLTNQSSENIKIPSMIVQPFVENALLHGLSHKIGGKQLNVSFELSDCLLCIIEDNGIGRDKAREIKSRQKGAYESFSTKAIQERMDVLSKQFEVEIGYQFTDLFDEKGASGTRVEIRLPYKEF